VPSPSGGILPLRFEGVGLELGGATRLHDLDFELEAGPCSVILGPNGAGKSLALRLAHGLLQPSRGRVCWLGPRAAEAASQQAMVLQRPVLLRRRVTANLDYALRLRRVPAPERRDRVAETLERAGLSALAGRPARSLSVGEQQRVALARAWVVSPEVLWLDEPATALDPGATRALEETIRSIRASGTKIVMSTHDLGQARRLADEVLFLHRGRLLEQTPAATFFSAPATPEAAAFLKGELLI
jgi:tungstate transport system ATP-binding protein